MELPLVLRLQPSRGLRTVLLGAHVVAALSAVWITAVLGLFLLGGIVCILAVSLFFSLRQPSMTGLVLLQDGNLKLLEADGKEIDAYVEPSTTVFPWLVVLNLKAADGRKIRMTLPADALAGETHRQLRVWLLNSARCAAMV